MELVNLELLIARRTARNAEQRRGVMVRIATFSVALCIAVMILTLAVIMGFKREVVRRMVGFTAHAQVTDVRGVESISAEPILRTAALDSLICASEGVERMAPYAVKAGLVRTPDALCEMVLKGVDPAYDWSFFRDFLVEGALPDVGDSVRAKDILMSRLAADKLMVGVGDKVEMFFVDPSGEPRRDRFKVSGIYSSGMEELDKVMLMTDLRNVQRLSGWTSDQVTGYELFFDDFARLDERTATLSDAVLYSELEEAEGVIVISTKELNAGIFDWLRAHDVNAAVVITIMIIVAFFNMATALLILVLERTRMVGLLKTMGMCNRSVQRIFLWHAAFVTGRGLVWGNVVGLLICFVQNQFHILKLNSEGYLLTEVPVAFGWGWWLALNVGAMAVILLLMTLPVRVVSTVKPSETIRYE